MLMSLHPVARLAATSLALALALTAGPSALAAPPIVESVVPGIGPRGAEFTVLITGGKLDTVGEVVLQRPGLTCVALNAVSDTELRVTFRADAHAPLGAHPFRLRAPGGLSDWRVVHLGRFPVALEVEPNDAPDSAQPVARNTTVAGVVDAGDVDAYQISLEAGRRLSVEVQAIRLGGELLDATLAVLGPDGRTLAFADDTALTRQDPFMSLITPESGIYTLVVRDTGGGGGRGATYALHVGDFPRPSTLFPLGAQAGRAARFVLDGATSLSVDVPGDAGPWWELVPTLDGSSAPTPTLLRVRPYTCVDEADTTESAPLAAEGPTPREWPVAFHGVVGGPGDEDAHAITARAGEAIQVEVFAARLGSLLDATIEVLDPSGEPIGRSDDDASHDARLVFEARADGPHRIVIRDRRRDGGPLHGYRIEVDHPRPALTLFPAGVSRKSQSRQEVAVPRGNRVLAYLGVRRDGFAGPVEAELGDLPPGVSADLEPIAADTYLAPVVVEAAADAPLGARLVEVRGHADTPAGTVRGGFTQVVDLVPGSGDSSYQSVIIDRLSVAVVEPPPYRVELEPPRDVLARDGALELRARIVRDAGFAEPIEVSFPYLPPGVEMDGPTIVSPDQTEAVLRLSARPDADPTTWRLAAEARPAPPRRDRREMTLALTAQISPGGGRRRASTEGLPPVASAFTRLDLATSPLVGRLAPATVERGGRVEILCELDAETPIASPTTATLEGLPPRAEAAPVALAPGARRFAFIVTVAPTTPAGDHTGLVCRLTTSRDGLAVVRRVGRGGRLKVSPPGAVAVDDQGRLLSPLDVLLRREAETRRPEPGLDPNQPR